MGTNKLDNTTKPEKKKYWALIILVSMVVLFVIIGIRLFQSDGGVVNIGEAPENFIINTYSGETIDTSSLKGKVLLINFWASWCIPCADEALLLEEAWKQIDQEGSVEVVFLGLAYNDTEPAARAFLEEYGITYPNGPDLRGEISNIFNVKGVPETYILDQNGKLQFIKYGPFISIDEINNAIEQVLANQDGG